MSQLSLVAQFRTTKGKGANKKLRLQKMIPAVFYGPRSEAVSLTVQYADLQKLIKQSRSDNLILDLQIESTKGAETKKVLLKELQIDSLKDVYLHADFYEISMDRALIVDVPLRLINIPVGVGKGGILQFTRREVTVSCLPDRIPEYLEVDVAALEIGQTVQIKDILFPDGITSKLDSHLSVAGVVAPSAEKVEVKEEAAEGAEGAAPAEDKGEAETKAEPKAKAK